MVDPVLGAALNAAGARAAEERSAGGHRARTSAGYTLAMLTLIATVNIVDRQLMSLLAQPVKIEMGLSDSQLGIILGPATGLLFLVLGVPLARLADRTSRKQVISVCLFFFSLATAACGLVVGFVHLLLARIAVAAGEAGTLPASQSIVSDLFPPEQRTLALSALTSATCLGTLLAFGVGGYVTAEYGWRMAFFIWGAPGLILCAIFALTTREPRRPDLPGSGAAHSMWRSLMFLWSLRPFRRVCYAYSLYMTGALTIVLWLPPYFARSFELGPARIGLIMALSVGVLGFIGSYLFGWLAQKLARKDFRWNLWSVACAALVGTPFLWGMLLMPDLTWVLLFGIMPALLCNFHQAPSIAVIQSITPPRMRSEASALILTLSSVVAASIGPFVAGAISDLMSAWAGQESLRYSLALVSLTWPVAAFLFWWAARSLSDQSLRNFG